MSVTAEFEKFRKCFEDGDEEAFASRLPELWTELGKILREINDELRHGRKGHTLEAIVRAAEDLSGVGWRESGDRASFVRAIIKGHPGDDDLRFAIFFLLHNVTGYEAYAERADYAALGFKKSLQASRSWAPTKSTTVHDIKQNAERLRLKEPIVSFRGRTGVGGVTGSPQSLSPRSSTANSRLPPALPNLAKPPGYYQTCRSEYKTIRTGLLRERSKSGCVKSVVYGPGGYGKTALAEEICVDPDIMSAFPGGIYWLQFGVIESNAHPENLDFIPVEIAIDRMLREQYGLEKMEQASSSKLTDLLDKLPQEPLLIIADDTWNSGQCSWMQNTPDYASILVTTRNAALIAHCSEAVQIERLTQEASFRVLTHSMSDITVVQELRLRRISEALKGWPLLLGLANGVFRSRTIRGRTLDNIVIEYEDFLNSKDLLGWEVHGVEDGDTQLNRRRYVSFCIELGVRTLRNESERTALRSLGVFPDDMDIPFSVVADFWQERTKDNAGVEHISKPRALTYLETFNELSFFRKYDPKTGKVRLHDEVLAYFRQYHKPDALEELHLDLANSIQNHCRDDWSKLPIDHQYGWRYILHHLEASDQAKQASALRLDFSWLKGKLNAIGTLELQNSFLPSHLTEDEMIVARAINLSAPVLRQYPAGLAHQLFGRLAGGAEKRVAQIVQQAKSNRSFWPKLLRAHLNSFSSETLRFEGHFGTVSTAVFDADDTRVLTISDDGSARIWSVETGSELRRFVGHSAKVSSAVICNGGKHVLTSSSDKTARLWSTETGIELQCFTGHSSEVLIAALTNTGSHVLTVSSDCTVRRWSATTGHELQCFVTHDHAVWGAMFDADQKRVLTFSKDHTSQLWSTRTGARLQCFQGHEDLVVGATFDLDEQHVLTASWDGTARLWCVETGRELRCFDHGKGMIFSATFDQAEKHVLTASSDGIARLWSIDAGLEVQRFTGHGGIVQNATFDLAEKHVLTASNDGTARLWSIDTGLEVQQFAGHRGVVRNATPDTAGQNILTASSDRTARLWSIDLETNRTVPERHLGAISSAVLSSDASRILTASHDGTAALWSVDDGRVLQRFVGHEQVVSGAVFDAREARVLTRSVDRTARLWSAETGEELHIFRVNAGTVRTAMFSNSEQEVLTSSQNRTVQVWSSETGIQRNHVEMKLGSCRSMGIDPEARYLLTVSKRYLLQLWCLETARELRQFKGRVERVKSATFDPKGTSVLTVSTRGNARLWSIETGNELQHIDGGGHEVLYAKFDTNADLIWAAMSGGDLLLWSIESSAVVQRIFTLGLEPPRRVLASNSHFVLTVHRDCTLHLFSIRSGALISVVHFDHTITCADFCSNRIVLGDEAGQIHVLDTAR